MACYVHFCVNAITSNRPQRVGRVDLVTQLADGTYGIAEGFDQSVV